ncbi:MAG: hypothetical protein HYT71_00405 [Candidatus Aenigmarchaeota archaeon]|nr:hypothetical protein [Candidatus Aenigmarchaeota archaeon]
MGYKKGITPVIALVMLMLITVGIVGLAYTWFSGLVSTQTEKGISIPPGGARCYKQGANNYVSVVIQNNGATAAVSRSDIILATINGVDCTAGTSWTTGTSGEYFPSAGIGPGSGSTIMSGRGSSASCANGTGFAAGTYPVAVGTRTNVAQTQVICT